MKWLHSISFRITLAIATMGLVTAISIGIGAVVFHAVRGQVQTVNADRIPEVGTSTNLILATGGLNDTLNSIGNATSEAAVSALGSEVASRSSGVRDLVDTLGQKGADTLGPMVQETETALNALIDARRKKFQNRAEIARGIQEMAHLEEEVATGLNGLVDDAHFDLVIEGESAIESVGGVLTNLLEKDILTLRLAHQIRAEANMLSGLSISFYQTDDAALVSILRDLATGAQERYESDLAELQGLVDDADVMAALGEGAEYFAGAFKGRNTSPKAASRALSVRQGVDSALSTLIDDLEFNLTIEAETAKETNAATIQGVLDNQVGRILAMAKLENSTRAFVALALEGATAADQSAMIILQERLTAAAGEMEQNLIDDLPQISEQVEQLIRFADPDSGIIGLRSQVVGAEKTAAELAKVASAVVLQIGREAAAFNADALSRIENSGQTLSQNADWALSSMLGLALAGAVIFVATRILVHRSVTRPLSELCAKTERLSTGNMEAIGDLTNRKDEIGRMAQAMEVFRNNALKMDELRAENDRRQQEAQELQSEMISLLSREIGTVVQAGTRGDFSCRVNHSFEDPKLASLADGVNKLVASVAQGVNETRKSLTAIANADLTHRVDENLEGIFAELGEQTNATAGRLAQMVSEIRSAAEISATRSTQVSDGAKLLAHQAESQAASVEETSAAMENMATTIKSSADTLTEAERLSKLVAEKTNKGAASAAKAVESVQVIATHSEKITQINKVIESISFQTNLLSLNAAVEAARAGEAGKGFAVVASEVRALAQRSSEAANEIGSLVQESTKSVELGVKIVSETRRVLEEIEEATQPVLAAIGDVAQNGNNQARSISEVSASVKEIDALTQKNAGLAEQSSSHSTDLMSQIQSLMDLVSVFQVEAGSTRHVTSAENTKDAA